MGYQMYYKDEWTPIKATGSPSSRIDKAVFNNEREIEKYTFEHFGIRK